MLKQRPKEQKHEEVKQETPVQIPKTDDILKKISGVKEKVRKTKMICYCGDENCSIRDPLIPVVYYE